MFFLLFCTIVLFKIGGKVQALEVEKIQSEARTKVQHSSSVLSKLEYICASFILLKDCHFVAIPTFIISALIFNLGL